MKTIKYLFLIIGSVGLYCFIILFAVDRMTEFKLNKIKPATAYIEKIYTDWELLIFALIWQESKGNPNPKHSDGKSEGILQITPIYVKEANRILGKSKYTLHDRRNPLKSHEMLLVVQNYHNPEKDVKKAVLLHNKAGWYFEEVMDRYNCLKLYQEILTLKNK